MCKFITAIKILDNDKIYADLMLQLTHNSNKYFNSFYKLPDSKVLEGKKIEVELGEKADNRAKELGLIKAPTGFWMVG